MSRMAIRRNLKKQKKRKKKRKEYHVPFCHIKTGINYTQNMWSIIG